MYKKGEVIFVDIDQDHIKGREQYGKRPCVILADFPKHQLAIVAPTTTTQKTSETRVSVQKGQGGLTDDSDILLHQLRVVSYERLSDKLGTLNSGVMNKVDVVLQDILDV